MLPSWILAKPLLPATQEEPHSRWWALAFTGLYVAASLIYGLLSNAPWDDDCVVRYFHTREVWSKPSHFFSLWNRPLFMVLFAPTAWLGRTVMMVQMIAIGAGSGWLLYRSLQRLGSAGAHWVLPFFFFQTFYFSVSRNFLTEPLAVGVICWGLHALVHQRYTLFAILGGLLPLARLELVAILPLWAIVLLQARQYRNLLLMGVPVVILMVAGYFVKDTDSLLWLVDETLGKEGKNRYGHRDVWHYFHRFAYVTGPVVFLFLVTGLLERLVRLRADLFIVLQGAGILFLYVIFSWKLDMGNSAGFLRNLIPLTPFIAVLAYDGAMAWWGASARVLVAPVHAASRDERKRQKKAQAKTATTTSDEPGWWPLVRVHLFGAIALLILWFYFAKELLSHHKISGTTDRIPFIIAAALWLLGVLLLAVFRKRMVPAMVRNVLGAVIAITALAFTMHSERPDAHLNHERKAITEVSTLYRDSYLREFPLYCNHTWFFWPKDLGYPDHAKYRVLNKAALDTAAASSVVLWENHYSHRLQGNVQLTDMYKRGDMVELMHITGRDHRTQVGLFQKTDQGANTAAALRQRFNSMYPNNIYAVYAEQLEHARAGRHADALSAAQRMAALDSTYAEAVLAQAQTHFALGRYDEAIAGFTKALQMDTALFSVHYSIAASQLRKQDYAGAVSSIKRYHTRDKKLKEAYEVLGAAHFYLKAYDKAIAAFTEYIKLDGRSTSGWLNRASAYAQTNNTDLALADYDVVLRLDPKNRVAQLNKALLLVRKGRTADGCALLQQLAAAGDATAQQQLAAVCK